MARQIQKSGGVVIQAGMFIQRNAVLLNLARNVTQFQGKTIPVFDLFLLLGSTTG